MAKAIHSTDPIILELLGLLKKVKEHLHTVNRLLMVKGATPWSGVRIQVEKLWGTLHSYRVGTEQSANTEQLLLTIDKAAGQASRLRAHIQDGKWDDITREYMVLRQYVTFIEKAMVRHWHYTDTSVVSTQIGTIRWAASLTGMSEVTIRRYIRSAKIRAYQMSKQWWIPYEELEAITKGGL